MTPAGTSIDVQNEWEEKTHTHTSSEKEQKQKLSEELHQHVLFVIHVLFSLSFVCLCFSLLSLELGRCSSDLFLSSRPRTGLATTCIIGYG